MCGWVWSIRPFRDRLRNVAMVTNVWRENRYHSVLWHSTTDARVNTGDESSTSDKNLRNFGPVNSEFCRLVCTGRATRWALPSISSFCIMWPPLMTVSVVHNAAVVHLYIHHVITSFSHLYYVRSGTCISTARCVRRTLLMTRTWPGSLDLLLVRQTLLKTLCDAPTGVTRSCFLSFILHAKIIGFWPNFSKE